MHGDTHRSSNAVIKLSSEGTEPDTDELYKSLFTQNATKKAHKSTNLTTAVHGDTHKTSVAVIELNSQGMDPDTEVLNNCLFAQNATKAHKSN